MALSAPLLTALRVVRDRLAGLEEPWRVTASVAAALHGAAHPPRDLDVETTAAGAAAIDRLLADHRVQPLRRRDRGPGGLVSDFARYAIGPVTVEVMGDLQTRAPDGTLRSPLIGRSATGTVAVDGLAVPVPSLAALERFYAELGRQERVALVRSIV